MTTQDDTPHGQDTPSWRKGWESEDFKQPWEWHLMQEKVEHLENRERRFRWALITLGAVMALMLAYQVYPREMPPLEHLRAKRIDILSADGLPVLTLDSDKVGGRMAIRFNIKKEPPPPAAFFFAAPEGGSFQLYEPGENFFAFSAKVDLEGNGRVDVRGRGLRKGLELIAPATEEDGGALKVYDAQGEVSATLPASP